MKILIIEDENILSEVLKEKFENNKFKVKIAENGDGVISMIKSFKPDIITLDLVLPKMSGFDILKLIRSDEDTKLIPVIVISNLSDDEEIKKALRLGADDYFVKTNHPIKELVEKVVSFLVNNN